MFHQALTRVNYNLFFVQLHLTVAGGRTASIEIPVTPEEAFDIGSFALHQGMYTQALEWLVLASELNMKEPSPFPGLPSSIQEEIEELIKKVHNFQLSVPISEPQNL